MKYECENCGVFYSDEDVTEEGEMREDYLGVRFWATFHYCPCCGEEVITDISTHAPRVRRDICPPRICMNVN